MKTGYLIESPDGCEKRWTDDLHGYDDWKIIDRGTKCKPEPPPSERDDEWRKGLGLNPADLADRLWVEIKELRRLIEKLEGKP